MYNLYITSAASSICNTTSNEMYLTRAVFATNLGIVNGVRLRGQKFVQVRYQLLSFDDAGSGTVHAVQLVAQVQHLRPDHVYFAVEFLKHLRGSLKQTENRDV